MNTTSLFVNDLVVKQVKNCFSCSYFNRAELLINKVKQLNIVNSLLAVSYMLGSYNSYKTIL